MGDELGMIIHSHYNHRDIQQIWIIIHYGKNGKKYMIFP